MEDEPENAVVYKKWMKKSWDELCLKRGNNPEHLDQFRLRKYLHKKTRMFPHVIISALSSKEFKNSKTKITLCVCVYVCVCVRVRVCVMWNHPPFTVVSVIVNI